MDHHIDTSKNETPLLTLDIEKYLSQLEAWDIVEEKKIEFVEAMWWLMLSSAQISLGTHPVNLAQKATGKTEKNTSKPCILNRDDVNFLYSNHRSNTEKSIGFSTPDGKEKRL